MFFAETDIRNKKETAGKPANSCPEGGCTPDGCLFEIAELANSKPFKSKSIDTQWLDSSINKKKNTPMMYWLTYGPTAACHFWWSSCAGCLAKLAGRVLAETGTAQDDYKHLCHSNARWHRPDCRSLLWHGSFGAPASCELLPQAWR